MGGYWKNIIAKGDSVSIVGNISEGYKGQTPFEDMKKDKQASN